MLKITKSVEDEMCAKLSEGMGILEICSHVGISNQALYNRLRTNPNFEKRWKRIRAGWYEGLCDLALESDVEEIEREFDENGNCVKESKSSWRSDKALSLLRERFPNGDPADDLIEATVVGQPDTIEQIMERRRARLGLPPASEPDDENG